MRYTLPALVFTAMLTTSLAAQKPQLGPAFEQEPYGTVPAKKDDAGKVLVEGIGRIKKHTRVSTSQRGAQQGGIVTQEAAIHVSNVMVVDSEGTPTRVGYRKDSDGRNIRVSRRTGKDL